MTHSPALPAVSSAAFDVAIRTLRRLKSAAWRAIRSGNESMATAAARAVEAEEESFRQAFFPNALKVFVLADDERGHDCSIYAVFPSGPECVFEAHAERVA